MHIGTKFILNPISTTSFKDSNLILSCFFMLIEKKGV